MSNNGQSDIFDIPFNYNNIDTMNPNQNVMKVKSISGAIDTSGYEACLVQMYWPNSVPNFPVGATFTLNIPTSTGTNAVACTIDANASLYVSDFNNLLKFYSEENNFYLVNAAGEKEYFVSAVFNPTYTKAELIFTNVPTSLPSGYSNPAGMTFPATPSWAQLVLTDTYILRLLGFDSGTYPPAMTPTGGLDFNELGSTVPLEQPNDTFIVLLNVCENTVSEFSNYLASVDNIDTPLGFNIRYQPPQELYVPCSNTRDNIVITVVDAAGNDVKQLSKYWGGRIRFRRIGKN